MRVAVSLLLALGAITAIAGPGEWTDERTDLVTCVFPRIAADKVVLFALVVKEGPGGTIPRLCCSLFFCCGCVVVETAWMGIHQPSTTLSSAHKVLFKRMCIHDHIQPEAEVECQMSCTGPVLGVRLCFSPQQGSRCEAERSSCSIDSGGRESSDRTVAARCGRSICLCSVPSSNSSSCDWVINLLERD
jgi:hypothetical protein